MLIDSHCHLDLPHFDEDRDDVVARAEADGIQAMITIGIDLDHSRAAIALAERYANVFATVGVHPNECAGFDADTLLQLHQLATHPKVVAVGEIGLDHHWQRTTPQQQALALSQQLDLAAELGLPVVIHDREAHDPLRTELRAWIRHRLPGTPLATRPMRGVLHSFSGDLDMAQEAYDWGFILSLAGPVTFKNARELRALVPHLRPDRMMIETDAPYLTPHPLRGKRNEPVRVQLVAQELAHLWHLPLDEVVRLTSQTAKTFYDLPDRPGAETT